MNEPASATNVPCNELLGVELEVLTNGQSGMEIRTKMPKAFSCGEARLRNDVPITIFISPWIQFEPMEMNEYRQKVAQEIIRRVVGHEAMADEISRLRNCLESYKEAAAKTPNTLSSAQRDSAGTIS